MRRAAVSPLLVLLLLPAGSTWAWLGQRTARNGPLTDPATFTRRLQPAVVASTRFKRKAPPNLVILASLATPPAESASSSSSSSPPGNATTTTAAASSKEVASGRVLEGGKVIDFSNLKASERAEMALRQARHDLLERKRQSVGAQPSNQHEVHHQQQELSSSFPINGDLKAVAVNGDSKIVDSSTSSSTAILGINQDVIDLVGHELGAFATAQEIQECAAYLRSKAPPGLLLESSDSSTKPQYTPEQVAKFRKILDRAYFEAGEVTSAFAKTFYMGTMLLPDKAREAIWAVYVWCRRTDEIVDAPRDDDKEMLLDLSAWELRLENLFERGMVEDVYDLCLLDCRVQYPAMDITPFMDMIRGMLMDVPGLGQDRYEKFDELHLYCYRVAGTVGLMSLPIFGCAPGYDDETARYVCDRVIGYGLRGIVSCIAL
jgi:15-cis-phytoene synthase